MISAVIFDFDGVIVRSEGIHKKTFEDLLNISVPEERWYQEFAGTGSRKIFRKLLDENSLEGDIDDLVEKRRAMFNEYVDNGSVPLTAGLFDFLHHLESRHVKTAIASGGHRGYIDKILNHYQFVFDYVVTADDTEFRKPDPRVFLNASQNLEVEAHECLVIEDSYSGCEAARKAGMKLVWFQPHPTLAAPDCDLVAHDFVDRRIFNLL